jgi:hypothetical protein
MKELLYPETRQSDGKIALVAEAKASAYEVKPLGHMNSGHTLWEIDVENGIIDAAEFHTTTVHLFDKHKKAQKFIKVKKGCIYIPALNEKNALKKFNNLLGEKKYVIKS